MAKDLFRLKVPESEKTEEWYKYQRDRIVPNPHTSRIEDRAEMERIYQLINNDLSGFRKEINYYCGVLDEHMEVEEELIPYNPLPTKLEVLRGELIARGNTLRVMLLTAKAIRRKDQEFQQMIKKYVDEELRYAVDQVKAQMEGMDTKQQDEYIQNLRKEILPHLQKRKFSSQAEIVFSKLLQHAELNQRIVDKKLGTLDDMLAVARGFLYTGWKAGRPYIKELNPLNLGFDKNPNEPFIQKGDYAWYLDQLTVADTLEEYNNILSDDQIREVLQFGTRGNPLTSDHVTRPVHDETRWHSLVERFGEQSIGTLNTGLNQGTQRAAINWSNMLYRTHLEFKAFKPVIFLTHTDERGEPVTVMVNENTDIIPSNAQKVKYINRFFEQTTKYVWADVTGQEYEAEIYYIPRRYEMTNIMGTIDIQMREVPFQPDYGDDPFNRFELSYKGGIFFNRNAKAISPIQRAMPYVFQYMALRRIQDREMGKFVGQETVIDVDQIPEELGNDFQENGQRNLDITLEQDIIARKTGKRFVSNSRNSRGLPAPTTRGAGVTYNVVDGSAILQNLEGLCDLVDRRIGLRMGISPQREAQPVGNVTATDNRQALMQSSLATSSIFYYVDKIWAHALEEHLRGLVIMIRQHFANNPNSRSYELESILPDGSREFFSVTPEHLDQLEDIGLYLHDNGKERIYFDMMFQNVFSFAQNAGEGVEQVSELLKALVRTTSIEEAHAMIQVQADAVRERVQAEQQAQAASMEEMRAMQMELAQAQSDMRLQADLAKIDAKAAHDLETAAINSKVLANQYDIDQNKVNDMNQSKQMELDHEKVENAKDRAHEIRLEQIKARSKPKST